MYMPYPNYVPMASKEFNNYLREVMAVKRIDEMNDKYGAEVMGFCFDTGHANLVGIKFQEFIQTLGSRLKVLHVHDNDGMADLHQVPFTFTRSREQP